MPFKTKEFIYPDWREEQGVFSYPASPDAKGFTPWGFDRKHDASLDMLDWEGFQCEAEMEADGDAAFEAGFADGRTCSASFALLKGRHRFFLSLDAFDLPTVNRNIWRFFNSLKVSGCRPVSITALRSRSLYVQCEIRGKSALPGSSVCYQASVTNCMEKDAFVNVKQICGGWESMFAICEPAVFSLEANETKQITITLTVPRDMPAGGHEKTQLRFTANGETDTAFVLTLYTMSALSHPYIYHDQEGWRSAARRGQTLPQFKQSYDTYLKDANAWEIMPPEEGKPYCYATQQEHFFMSCAYAYTMTGEKRYAEKIAAFFRLFAPAYLIRQRGCSQSYVQEGHFFQHLAISYDIIHDAGVLTEEEHRQIEACFRFYMEVLDQHLKNGHTSNWLLSEITGALYCAFALQDPERIHRFAFGNGGTQQQLIRGTFNDGWWHECSVSYNTWVSSMLLHTARALRLLGIDWVHKAFPVSYSHFHDATWMSQAAPLRFDMDNERRGGNTRISICIKDIFDAPLPYLDARGVIFGMCDSYERRLEGIHFGSTYELAYQYYRDPRYAAVIRAMDTQDCVFGVEDLPEAQLGLGGNAHSDNIGIAMLRSRTPGRKPLEQIQAVLRYGSHGYAHGHFDRASLLSVMRYGRSFFNPECTWWGYPHFMYKFYVQNSMIKNMVAVDEKHQNVADSKLILFAGGKKLQAACVETEVTWSYPPYGGMVYDENESLQERCRYNGCSLKVPENVPAFGQVTGYTEPILTRRLMAVADDYIVLFDYLKGTQPHRFSNLYQIKGFEGLAGNIQSAGHTRRFSDDPLSDAQFITDCSHFDANGPTCAHFVTVFGPGEDLRGTRSECNEPGLLKMDVHAAWPPKNHQVLGLAAEDHKMYIPVRYTVCADDRLLAQGEEGLWLGYTETIRGDVSGAKKLTFRMMNLPLVTEQLDPFDSKQGLFLGNAVLKLSDGSICRLCDLPYETINIDSGFGIGRDYENSRVLLSGQEATDAIPVSAMDHSKEAIIIFDLSGLDAVSLEAELGVDAFPGDEQQRRRTYAIQQTGTEARFVTVIEPFEKEAIVKAVETISADEVKIRLRNGSAQTVRVQGLTEGTPAVILEEVGETEKLSTDEKETSL